MATKTKLKTINLKGKEYVQVDTRVTFFNETYGNGRITTIPTFNDNTVYFKATVIPDLDNKERKFTGHSFGILGKEKALEKLETVAVGRALAFMGIGIIESIASADEMNNFNNNQKKQYNDGYSEAPRCSICGKEGFKSKKGNWVCPDWTEHKADGVRGTMEFPKNTVQTKVDDVTQQFMDELDAQENIPKFDNQSIKK